MATPTKESRLHVRLSLAQDALIRHAAMIEGKSLTDFAVEATMDHAKDVLADRRLFQLDEAAWEEFTAILERPVVHKPRLANLLTQDSIFDE